jgi:hypothetical protein
MLIAGAIYRSVVWCIIGAVVAVISCAAISFGASKTKDKAIRAITRRLALTVVWPVLYFMAVAFVATVTLALLYYFLPVIGFLNAHLDPINPQTWDSLLQVAL